MAPGPERVFREGKDPDHAAELLGTETDIETFTGVVSGVDGPWGVGVHVVRAIGEDHLIVAGVHRRPVGSVPDDTDDGESASPIGSERIEQARCLLTDAIERLEPS